MVFEKDHVGEIQKEVTADRALDFARNQIDAAVEKACQEDKSQDGGIRSPVNMGSSKEDRSQEKRPDSSNPQRSWIGALRGLLGTIPR